MSDWEKELAKVDKQIASLSDGDLARPSSPTSARPGNADARTSAPAAAARARTPIGVVLRLTLSVLLGGAMLLWPYQARCGAGLAGYLGAVTVVVGGGIWSGVWSWRHRASRAHVLSLLLVLLGLVLGAMEVLPRIGYAKPDARHPATWVCP